MNIKLPVNQFYGSRTSRFGLAITKMFMFCAILIAFCGFAFSEPRQPLSVDEIKKKIKHPSEIWHKYKELKYDISPAGRAEEKRKKAEEERKRTEEDEERKREKAEEERKRWEMEQVRKHQEAEQARRTAWIAEAMEGNIQTQYKLGTFYYSGNQGFPQNQKEAIKWFLSAAERGHVDAQYHLGVCYFHGEGVPKDSFTAWKWFREAHKNGHREVTPAWLHLRLREAAERGHAEAQYEFGMCFYRGEGVPKDNAEAKKWFRQAQTRGHAGAAEALIEIDAPKEKAEEYRKLAEWGDVQAQYQLGMCYYHGAGVPNDKAESVKWFRKAADGGHAEALYSLGACYHNGEGVPKNQVEALKWYRMAAEQGIAQAQYVLGLHYLLSDNKAEAMKWLGMAADQGHREAISTRSRHATTIR